MAFLWQSRKKRKIIRQNPSPTVQGIPDSARNSGKKFIKQSPYIRRTMKKPSLLILLFRSVRAGMTVEAAIVLPLCLIFLMNLGCAVEMIRLHNNLQLALWDTGSRLSLYGCEQGGNTLASVVSGFYVRNRVVDYVGEEYLDDSPLVGGSSGLRLWESDMLKQGDELDITLTYAVGPMISLVSFRGFRMANRYTVHLWNGYEIPEKTEEDEVVFVAENGQVCHKDRNCTYLQLSVYGISKESIETERNQWGSRYNACDKCAKGQRPDTLYVTEEGTRFHYRVDCPGLKRTVYSLKAKETADYPYCSRCGGG